MGVNLRSTLRHLKKASGAAAPAAAATEVLQYARTDDRLYGIANTGAEFRFNDTRDIIGDTQLPYWVRGTRKDTAINLNTADEALKIGSSWAAAPGSTNTPEGSGASGGWWYGQTVGHDPAAGNLYVIQFAWSLTDKSISWYRQATGGGFGPWASYGVGSPGAAGANGLDGWTPVNNGTVRTNPGNYFKTGGNNNSWDAGVSSQQGYTTGCYCSMQAVDTTSHWMIGLNSDPLTDNNFTSIDYCWYNNAGSWRIYESGADIGSVSGSGTYVNDVPSISWDGSVVRYMMNGVVVRSVSRTSTTPLYLDSSFYETQAQVKGLIFGPMGSTGFGGLTYVGRDSLTAFWGNTTVNNGATVVTSTTQVTGKTNANLCHVKVNMHGLAGGNQATTTTLQVSLSGSAWFDADVIATHNNGNASMDLGGTLEAFVPFTAGQIVAIRVQIAVGGGGTNINYGYASATFTQFYSVSPAGANPTDSGWQSLSLGVGQNFANGFQTCQYRKKGDEVILRGLYYTASALGSGSVIATLPADFRPQATTLQGATGSNVANVRFDVLTNGQVVLQTAVGSGVYIPLDQIRFFTS